MLPSSRQLARYTYIATTRYSKEERASLELGDTVYPYDKFVEVLTPDVGGVVVLVTSLPPDFLGRLLSSYYLSAVEYVTYVISCTSCYGADVDSVASYVASSACRTTCFSKVRSPRAGSLGWEFIDGIVARISGCVSKNCSGTLSLEVFGSTLCFGPVVRPREDA